MNLKELLKKDLSKKQLSLVPRGFDVIGDVLLFNSFPDELVKKEKKIGERILANFPNIKVVAKKTGKFSGKYRTQTIKIIAGEKRKETTHKENDVRIKLHIQNTYFSPRTATERMRIAKKVKKGESVLVMFSGAAPFPLVIAKHSSPKEVYGIESNPDAHKYALENARKFPTIHLIKGEVSKVKLNKKFDRIVMPLPKTAIDFFPLALSKLKKKGTIHLYAFVENEASGAIKSAIKGICKEKKKKCRILREVKCGSASPAEYRTCFDISVS